MKSEARIRVADVVCELGVWLGGERPPIHGARLSAAYVEHNALFKEKNLPKTDRPLPLQFQRVNCHLRESVCPQCGSVLMVPLDTVRLLLEEVKSSFPLAL